jgi:probable rRNA maturation factor
LGVEISIVFCDDPWIAELNQTYLGRKGPTNVISFPMDEQDEGDAPLRMLGDVVINVDRAVSDAAEADLEPFYEITYLLIHGICHLAGFDHEGDQAHRALEMEAMERKLHSQFYPIFKEGIGGKKQTP